MYAPPTKLAVITLANSDRVAAMTLAREVSRLFIGGRFRDPASTAKPEPSDRTPEAEPITLEDLVGRYRLDSTGKVLDVTLEDGRLVLKNLATAGKALGLSRVRGGEFTVDGMSLKTSFTRSADGVVDRLTLHVGDPPQVATRVSTTTMTVEQLTRFAGTYMSSELLVVYSLAVRNGVLAASHSRLPPIALTPMGPHEFSGEKIWLRSDAPCFRAVITTSHFPVSEFSISS